jgi:pimeloyl-ACP methyl ester carboxylesterase
MPYVHTPGLQIHFQDAGAGPNVFVLLHGNFGSWRWWKQVFRRLPPGFRAYAPDLRGCGDTVGGGTAGDAYGIPQLADDLLAFVEGIDQRSFHLVGHSLGGAVALQFALAHPDRVLSLTLVAPPPATGLLGMREGNSASAKLLRTIDPENAPSMAVLHSSYRLHQALGTNRLMLRRALAKMMPTATLDRAEMKSLLRDAARMWPDAVVGFLQALHRWNVAAELVGLRVPTLVLAGGKDVLVPAAGLEQMAQLLPNGRLVVWPEVGHSPQIERPDEFVRLLVTSARRSPVMRLRTLLWHLRRPLNGSLPLAGPGAHEPLLPVAHPASVDPK